MATKECQHCGEKFKAHEYVQHVRAVIRRLSRGRPSPEVIDRLLEFNSEDDD